MRYKNKKEINSKKINNNNLFVTVTQCQLY